MTAGAGGIVVSSELVGRRVQYRFDGDQGSWWDEVFIAKQAGQRQHFDLRGQSQGAEEWKRNGECTMITGVLLDPLEHGKGRQWVLLEGEPDFVVPDGWERAAKPRISITDSFLSGLLKNKSKVRLMWRWDAPIDWACGSFVRANKGKIKGSAAPSSTGHVVVNYGETGRESRHYLQLNQCGTDNGELWVLIERRTQGT